MRGLRSRPGRLRTAATAQEYAVRIRRLEVLAVHVSSQTRHAYEQAAETLLLVEQSYADGLVTSYLRRRERRQPWGRDGADVVWALHAVDRFNRDPFTRGRVDSEAALAEVSIREGRVLAEEGGYVLREVVPHKLMLDVEILSPVEGVNPDVLATALTVWTSSKMPMQGTFRDVVFAVVAAS
jgi:hypothetical protein